MRGRYNGTMEKWIGFIISNFAVDLFLSIIMKKIFKKDMAYPMLLLSQVLFVVPGILYITLPISAVTFVLIKMFSGFIFCLVTAQNYHIKPFVAELLSYYALFFSIYGFLWFMLLFFKQILKDSNFAQTAFFDLIILLLIILYFAMLIYIFSVLSRVSAVKKYSTKVSFFIFGKHIEITGLFDTGNSLYDTKTKKPVVVVCMSALKRIIPRENYKRLIEGDDFAIDFSHYIKFVSVGSQETDMPVVDVGSIVIHKSGGDELRPCVIGLVRQRFDDFGGFEGLLHSEFE